MDIIQGIVTRPSQVRVDARQDEMGVYLVIQVDEHDMGIVIGQGGVHAQAIRILLRCAGGLHDVKASLKIEEPVREKDREAPPRDFFPKKA